MSVKEVKQGNLTWIHISRIDPEAIEYLKNNFKFHSLDIEDIRTEHPTPKLDVYKNYLFLIAQVPHLKISNEKIISHEVGIFVGEGYVITIQESKNREIKNLFYRCANNRKIRHEWMEKGPGFLLYNILNELFSEVESSLRAVGKQLSAIEDEVYKEEGQTVSEIKQLGQHRRNIFTVRRIIDPQRFIISTLSHTRRTFLDESLSIYFDDVRDLLDRLWVVAESYSQTSDGLHWTIESILNQRTNKIISALTIVSVSFMPLTLLTGFYGMNISLPHGNNPMMVYGIFTTLALTTILIIYILKRKRWL
ncbi:MAG TPA: magnesium transporter CorA family protein [Candidatus Magasanikbacteria bacterium]|nr:magnesium transporter CorA family protein [Candidatus Magasanikbacteria bacterium]